jgi:acyl-CoA synthetase (AMP-forming)/AMP-acid ligase II
VGSSADALQSILQRMRTWSDRPAVFDQGREVTYHELLADIDCWTDTLYRHGIAGGDVCGVLGEFSRSTCALFFALMRGSAITVPFIEASRLQIPELRKLAGVRWMITPGRGPGEGTIERVNSDDDAVISAFRVQKRPGLVVFTSGSSGRPKGILHDCDRVLAKFLTERRGWRTLLFLTMDHFGGFNTFLSSFAYGGTAVCASDRLPDPICRIVESGRVELLPVTPTFLRMVWVSGVWQRYDLSSVELITYGAEPMPQPTLDAVRAIFPRARLKQTYGLSELGVLRSRSPEEGSVWLQVGGDGFETRVVDGVLWIRSASSMVGYLNAPTPFDADGWMNTGDEVEERDGLIRFRGRTSDVINVGGNKVFPAEVEEVLLQAAGVVDATVYAVPHPLLGQVPCAIVRLREPESDASAGMRLRRHCVERLAKYKTPMRFVIGGDVAPTTPRFKKARDGR